MNSSSTDKFRVIYCNDETRNASIRYPSNEITTAKYSLLTFLPRSLFEQFSRAANVYFLMTCVLSFFPFSPFSSFTTVSPLCFVLAVSMVKEGIQDWQRHLMDSETNNGVCEVWYQGKWVKRKWKQLRVGEVVRVRKDESFPADLFLLSSTNESDLCYIETKNLDGETNLKMKKAISEITGFVNQETTHAFNGYVIQCEEPTDSLYTFKGNLEDGNSKYMITPEQVLLRGSALRNTQHVLGVTLYTGHDTRVMMNSSQMPSKRTTVERQLDVIVYFMFAILFSFSLLGALMAAYYSHSTGHKAYYIDLDNSKEFDPDAPHTVFLYSFLTGVILYSNLIPISLYVTVDIIKVVQSFVFINYDRKMYHPESDQPARARTSNLNEDLGRVQIVLSDKTGTLTNNVMEFFKCSIGGVMYGRGVTEVQLTAMRRRGEDPAPAIQSGESSASCSFPKGFNLQDERLLDGKWVHEEHADTIANFFRLLAVCHTVVPDGPCNKEELVYQAESPDESAFVTAAKVLGFFFYKRTNTTVFVLEGEEEVEYELLDILEFNSTRKRMSVICRRGTDRQLILFCKGADNVIYDRLRKDTPTTSYNPYAEETLKHLEEFGGAGLRTLCLAYREISDSEYELWHEEYQEARTTLDDNQQELLMLACDQVEKDLILLGATGIEDKLQEKVPQCIAALASAGVAIWMLTGDKVETAINIGFACSLLENNTSKHVIRTAADLMDDELSFLLGMISQSAEPALEGKKTELGQARRLLSSVCTAPSQCRSSLCSLMENASDELMMQVEMALVQQQMVAALGDIAANVQLNNATHNGLIIDGRALSMALANQTLQELFLKLGLTCQSIICCRVSPKQKGQVTKLVKDSGRVTLAIGDGANDVEMILAAHIGVGISGQEGMQAVMSSDFSIGQFRFLERLLLLHGHWNYKRISHVIGYFFYKNVLFGLSFFCFNSLTMFSGQTIYDDYYSSTFNLCFTSIPVFAIGVFDQYFTEEYALNPNNLHIYRAGQRNKYFNVKTLAYWFLLGIYQSCVLIGFTLLAFEYNSHGVVHMTGQSEGLYGEGSVLYTCMVLTANIQLALSLRYWNIFTHIAIWGSIAFWFLVMICYSLLPLYWSNHMYWYFFDQVANLWTFWLLMPLCVVTACLPDLVVRAVKAFMPLLTNRQILCRRNPDSTALASVSEDLMHPLLSDENDMPGDDELSHEFEEFNYTTIKYHPSMTQIIVPYRGGAVPDTMQEETILSSSFDPNHFSVPIRSKSFTDTEHPALYMLDVEQPARSFGRRRSSANLPPSNADNFTNIIRNHPVLASVDKNKNGSKKRTERSSTVIATRDRSRSQSDSQTDDEPPTEKKHGHRLAKSHGSDGEFPSNLDLTGENADPRNAQHDDSCQKD
ncbi:hypothetical protein CYMTET_50774 [Cymbomonas tetramitiformis]|uniref:Phospholipid-transporting ATPase n=1 Tax=Cymbomonas tetramitiformis TaxID=36881 RepID=A0AAE0ETC5_9CHLO|nr:hypothetical protein CYMTET_50774 [Cymbomonas tetramitiformis]